MSRYCVLSIPRTGSTWLTEGIYSSLLYDSLNENVTNLGEFFTLHPIQGRASFAHRIKYVLDEEAMIRKQIQSIPWPENLGHSLETLMKKRLTTLLAGDKNQPVVLKYMYWTPRDSEKINDLENFTKIKNHNFTIVNINRDPFESTVSVLVSKKTNFWIRTTEWNTKNIRLLTKSSITLSPEDVKSTYLEYVRVSKEKQKLADALNCVNVNYESLKSDCIVNQIPFEEKNLSKKVYNISYDEIITNYNELLEIKNQVDNNE